MAVQEEHKYFYGPEADQFVFYRIPKVLFSATYHGLSTDAKLLYGLMLDRMGLSIKNSWLDDTGRVFIYYPMEEIMKDLDCAHGRATALYRELEAFSLIERRKQGQGKPTMIYVLDFIDHGAKKQPKPKKQRKNQQSRLPESHTQTAENRQSRLPISRLPKIGSQDCRKREVSHYNETDMNDTEISIAQSNHRSGASAPPSDSAEESIEDRIKANIDYPTLVRYYPSYQDVIDGIVALMADECASTAPTSTISGQAIKREYIRSRLLKLRSDHIRRVLTVITDRAGRDYVTNTRGYLLTMLYRVYSDPLAAHLDYSADGLPLTPDSPTGH